MSFTILTVGRQYRNRLRQVVTITRRVTTSDCSDRAFLDSEGCAYMEDGSFSLRGPHRYDLIEEVPIARKAADRSTSTRAERISRHIGSGLMWSAALGILSLV